MKKKKPSKNKSILVLVFIVTAWIEAYMVIYFYRFSLQYMKIFLLAKQRFLKNAFTYTKER